jgi:hypothetical protein
VRIGSGRSSGSYQAKFSSRATRFNGALLLLNPRGLARLFFRFYFFVQFLHKRLVGLGRFPPLPAPPIRFGFWVPLSVNGCVRRTTATNTDRGGWVFQKPEPAIATDWIRLLNH